MLHTHHMLYSVLCISCIHFRKRDILHSGLQGEVKNVKWNNTESLLWNIQLPVQIGANQAMIFYVTHLKWLRIGYVKQSLVLSIYDEKWQSFTVALVQVSTVLFRYLTFNKLSCLDYLMHAKTGSNAVKGFWLCLWELWHSNGVLIMECHNSHKHRDWSL